MPLHILESIATHPIGGEPMDKQNMPPELARVAQGRDFLTTGEFARALNRAPQTVRKNLCLAGHCYGIKPRHVAGRLLWPVVDIAKVLNGDERHV
jgi:hypothetical protein